MCGEQRGREIRLVAANAIGDDGLDLRHRGDRLGTVSGDVADRDVERRAAFDYHHVFVAAGDRTEAAASLGVTHRDVETLRERSELVSGTTTE